MSTRSLKSLLVDYDVPPLEIIRAVEARRITPIVAAEATNGAVTVDNISFDAAEVENVFWRYSFKHKSDAAREELQRRFHRYVALESAIIAAVVGSGVTFSLSGVATPQVRPLGPRIKGMAFQLPLPPEYHHLTVSLAEHWIGPAHPGSGSFEMLASAAGEVESSGFVPGTPLNHLYIQHSVDVRSEYRLKSGVLHPLADEDQWVFPGQRVVRFSASITQQASAEFRLWCLRFGVWSEYPLTGLGWPIFPPEWAKAL
jgi:hypothetical protein